MERGRNEVGSETEDRAEPARGSARERRETNGIRSEGREGRRQGIREHHTVVGDALPEVRGRREGRNRTEVERKGGNAEVSSIFRLRKSVLPDMSYILLRTEPQGERM